MSEGSSTEDDNAAELTADVERAISETLGPASAPSDDPVDTFVRDFFANRR
jgi:hypothetical protein